MDASTPGPWEGKDATPTGQPTGETGGPSCALARRQRLAATAPTEPRSLTLPPQTRPQARNPARGRLRTWARRAGLCVLAAAAAFVALMLIWRFVDPTLTPTMAVRAGLGEPVEHFWVPLDRISPALVRAVIASEDGHFCTHHGIDLGELRAALREARRGISPRGASTISMQVVKNLFLWPGRSYVRKALELPLVLVLETVWSKRRILEVYLNIAEWGPGIYGAEAAARSHFGTPAARLDEEEAALLAVSLPNPVERDAANPEPRLERLAELISARVRAGVNTRCLR